MPTFTDNPLTAGQAQFMESSTQGAGQGSLCVAVGSDLYYVTSAQVGVAQATLKLWILKSTDGGATWSQVYNGLNGLANIWVFAVCPVGTTIYIAAQALNAAGFTLMRWDTATDAFLSNGAAPPVASVSNTPLALAAFSDASLLAAYVSNATGDTVVTRYTPGSNAWSAQQSTGPGGYAPVGITVQSTVDRAFVFLVKDGAPSQLACVSVTNPTTLGTFQQLLASTPNADAFSRFCYYSGFPIVWNSDSEIVFPYLNPGNYNSPNSNVLVVFRAPVAVNPVFVTETVEGSLGAGLDVTTFPSALSTAAAAMELDGLLYLFYMVDNDQGSIGSASSESYVYYRTNTGVGLGWSASAIAFTADIPNEPLSLYPVPDTGLMLGLIDPTTFFAPATKYASLTMHFLAIASAPVVADAFRVALYGYKRFKNRPVCAPDLVEVPDVPGPPRVL